ncbi:MAG: hypothetical protein V1676_05365 [Candidatus Diapherotrites archaeon]
MGKMDDRSKFLTLFVNLPAPMRKEIAVIVDGQPFSWERAYREIQAETKLGKKMLKELSALKLWG